MLRFLCFLLPFGLWGQTHLSERFQDPNWGSSHWYGDTASFNRHQDGIQLNDSLAGTKVLLHPCKIAQSATWELHGAYDFNPSASNFLSFTLMADHLNPDSSYFEYEIRLGGNSQDQFQFYRKDTGQSHLLWVSSEDWLDLNSVQYHLKVYRSSKFEWSFWADTGNFHQWHYLGSVWDSSHLFNTAIRLQLQYSKTRSTKFFIDSIFFYGSPAADTIPPKLEEWSFLNDSLLHLVFSEKLAAPVISLSASRLNLDTWQWSAKRPREIQLQFSRALSPNQEYSLFLRGIKDRSGLAFNDSLTFLIRRVMPGELRISEIMADPSPKVDPSPLNFPEVEYLEVYNASPLPIPLEALNIRIGTRDYALPNFSLPPDSFAVLCAANTVQFWPQGLRVLGMDWSSSVLINSGTTLQIWEGGARLIESLYYQKSWYQNESKAEGGWSLERKDLLSDCMNEYNWSASNSPSGGSPGRPNSNRQVYQDSLAFDLLEWRLPSPRTLELQFNRSIDSDLASWHFSPNIKVDSMVSLEGRSLSFYFNVPLAADELFTLTYKDSLYDCQAKAYPFDTLYFGIPKKPERGALRISEILFNPYPEGIDFVELYNSGSDFIDLADLRLATWNPETEEIGFIHSLGEAHRIIAPQEVLVLAEDANAISPYYNLKAAAFQVISELPSLPDREGGLVLLRGDNQAIDYIAYHEDGHSAFIANPEGCSLFRLDFSRDALRPQDWQSTPRSYKYASPGWIPEIGVSVTGSGNWYAQPNYLSPNGDGYHDYLKLHFQFREEAWLRAKIVDARGMVQKVLEEGAYHPKAGFFSWDGANEEGELCPAGIYIAFLEYNLENGEIARLRCGMVLSR